LKRIIFTHGKNPKPPAAAHRQQLLRCLLHGVSGVDREIAAEIESSDCFTLVSWSHLFYERSRDIVDVLPWIDRLLAGSDPPADIRAARPLKYRVAHALYMLGDLMPWLIPLIPDPRVKHSIEETNHYFSNRDNTACLTRQLQKAPLREAAGRGERVLLIGHSMGSIIAWDSLWELQHLEGLQTCVDCFLTLGSPLGMNYVQRRLAGQDARILGRYPCNIDRWVNISSRGDLVALDPSLANDFHEMIDNGCVGSITDMRNEILNNYRDANGLNVHKSFGYLVNPHVAQVIADWWSQA
jgi:hypothetical protein